ncbi:MAG: hypothetical protein RL619_924 [Bacteroidota bacterium]|jgi:hypothetical protein
MKLQIDYSDNGFKEAFNKLNSKNGFNVKNHILALNETITFDTKSNKEFKVSFIFSL